MNRTATDHKFDFETLVNSIEQYDKIYRDDITRENYFGFPIAPILEAEQKLLDNKVKSVAYLSMEYGLAPSIYNSFQLKKPMSEKNKFFKHEVFSNYWISDYIFKIKIDKMLDIPIYSGGLGVLAGDTVKSIADLGLSVMSVGILWNKGYFKQNFWYKHGQMPEELSWDPWSYPGLIPLKHRVSINTKKGKLSLRLWKYYVYSYDKKNVCPLILLDSNVEENTEYFRKLTDQLYRSDHVSWRIFQRSILGIGAIKAIDSLGCSIDRYHLNEGHAAFAFIERYLQLSNKADMQDEKKKFMYTCHTPVAAGHDRFNLKDIGEIYGDEYIQAAEKFGKEKKDSQDMNLTYLCLDNCAKVNAVAQKHGEITRLQFPDFASKVDAITNGIHIHTWLSESFAQLFDRYSSTFGDWRRSPALLTKAQDLMGNEDFRRDIFEAHQVNKRNFVNVVDHWKLDPNVLTIGWARRITGYKRPSLLFHKIEEILKIANKVVPLQIFLAGKAHPNDNIGGAHIDAILEHIDALNNYYDIVKVLILENYDTYFGKLLSNSVDVWLNNPLPPFEASGTSGMKAILNGVVQCSTLDGWVVEAEQDDIGWIFGYRHEGSEIGSENDLRLDEDSAALYETIEAMAKMYYQTNQKGKINLQSPWISKMINCVRRAAFFNTQRMVEEYNAKMWELNK
ncbi:MAG: alpha-glucan family phosphorylase [Candidatus Omnitrophica bacterium]|nr:alpha-glucan family phosphorylase [Candidatus Omnitrophota bacterium]